MKIEFSHTPVMPDECIKYLNINPGGCYADCTAGGGGHSAEILKLLNSSGRLIAVDRDPAAVDVVTTRLTQLNSPATFNVIKSNFELVDEVFANIKLDGVLFDLGVSSHQLDTPNRGFAYNHDAPLDMRMDPDDTLTAFDIINTYTESQLTTILYKWSEERYAPQIASAICKTRAKNPINTTFELSNIVMVAIPAKSREVGHHPCKRTFQAVRIEVNHELDILESTIRKIVKHMNIGGRILFITFHSLEDRIIKQTFADLAKGCKCPSDFPICVCGIKPEIKLIEKKPVLPSDEEIKNNPRSRSAKLRIAEKGDGINR